MSPRATATETGSTNNRNNGGGGNVNVGGTGNIGGSDNCGGVNNLGNIECGRSGGFSMADGAALGSVLDVLSLVVAIITLCA